MTTNNATDTPLDGNSGTGNFVGSTGPTITSATLVTPALGQPTSGDLTHCTNYPSSNFSRPQFVQLTTGSGTAVTPANCTYMDIELVGGGGGGEGGNADATAGTATSFFSGVYVAGGGGASGGSVGVAVNGDINIFGQQGCIPYGNGTTTMGGVGGNTPLGMGGQGASYHTTGNSATNSFGGGGQGGGSVVNTFVGAGGSSGAYLRKRIVNPLGGYTYIVGTGGTGGTANTNTNGGGNGAPGVINIWYYFT